MAKYETTLRGNLNEIKTFCENALRHQSITLHLEDENRWQRGDVSAFLGVYERYSLFGQNRVSLTLQLIETGGQVSLCAIAAGGSQGKVLKINHLGENAFLNTLKKQIQRHYRP